MATTSIIAKKIGKDKYRAIFCKYDGKLADNGWILSKYYTTPERVDQLLELGDLYILGEKLSCAEKPGLGERVTIAYARDRGEELCPAKEYNLGELYALEKPYLYIFVKEDKWVYSGLGELEADLREVKKALKYLEDVDVEAYLLEDLEEEELTEDTASSVEPTLKP